MFEDWHLEFLMFEGGRLIYNQAKRLLNFLMILLNIKRAGHGAFLSLSPVLKPRLLTE